MAPVLMLVALFHSSSQDNLVLMKLEVPAVQREQPIETLREPERK